MGNVIKMDLYRLVKSFSFKIGLLIVFLINLLIGPIDKLGYNISKKIAESADNKEELLEELGEWVNDYHLGNVIAGQLGYLCTAIFLLVIVKFCFADIQHGYIKNIAGQLPSRGHTILSKFIVIEIVTPLFFIATIGGTIAGNCIIGREIKFDLFYEATKYAPAYTFGMGEAFGELAVKFVLLSGVSVLVLLLTTGFGSNIAGTVIAVVAGTGCTTLAYSSISLGINKLFSLSGDKSLNLTEIMPDSLYRSDLVLENLMTKGISVGILTIVVLLFFTLRLYNKKDIK